MKNPTGGGIVSHDPRHIGIDLDVSVSDAVPSPINGRVEKLVADVIWGTDWKGVVLVGLGDDAAYQVRLLGVDTNEKMIGQSLKAGDRVGIAIDATSIYQNIKQHIHFELYEDEIRVDPTDFVKQRWPNVKGIDPGTEYIDPQNTALNRAFEIPNPEKKRAILEKVLGEPVWETYHFEIYHRIADNYASEGKFEEAIELQRTLLSLLRAEQICAERKMPPEVLGVIGACRSKSSVDILLYNMSNNLAAYEQGQPTLIHY